MRVIFVSSIKLHKGESAGSSRVMNYARGLSKNNEIFLCSYNNKIIYKSEDVPVSKNIISFGSERVDNKSSIFGKLIKKITYPVDVYSFFSDLKKRLHEIKDDKVIVFYPSTRIIFDIYTILFFKLSGSVKVYYELNEIRSFNLRDIILSGTGFKKFKQRVKNIYLKIKYSISEYLIRYYDGVIAISFAIEKEVHKKNKNVLRIPILTNSSDINLEEEPFQDNDCIHLGYFGMVSNQKEDFETIFNALSVLKNKNIRFKFNVYGSIDKNTKDVIFTKLASDLGISEMISYSESIPHAEVQKKMKQNHVLLSIRRKSNQSHYSFSTKLAEYLSSGVPVIVSDVGDNPHFIKDKLNGFCIPVGDYIRLADRIKEIQKNYSDLYKSISKKAVKTVEENFIIDSHLEKFESFLSNPKRCCKKRKEKLKIAICTLAHFPEGLAVTNRVYYHAKGLMGNGAKVKVYIVKPTEFPIKVVNKDIDGSVNGIDFEYTPRKTTRSLYFLQRRYDDIFGPVFAAFKILRSDYDAVLLISSNSFYHVTLFKIIFKLFGIKFITERTELPFHNKKSNGIYKYKNQIYKKFVYKGLYGFLAISGYLVDHYNSMVSKKCPVLKIPVLIDESEIYRPEVKRTKDIVYTGPLVQTKDGILTILKSFEMIAEEYPESRLLMTGNLEKTPDKNEIKKIVDNSPYRSRMIFKGFISRNEMIDMLNSSACLVLAKPTSAQANACFPTKLGEYLSSANPIVVTRTGEIPIYLKDGENAYIAEPDSIESFTDKLREVFSDPVKAKQVGENGRQTAIESFNYIKNTKKVIDLINSRQI